MAVVLVRVFGDDAAPVAADLELLLRARADLRGVSVGESKGSALLSCEIEIAGLWFERARSHDAIDP